MRTVRSELRESTTTTSAKAETEARQPGRFSSSFRTGMHTETGRLIVPRLNFGRSMEDRFFAADLGEQSRPFQSRDGEPFS